MPAKSHVIACLLSLGALLVLASCGDDSNGGDPTATFIPEATATIPPTEVPETPTPSPDIRQEDLTQQPGLQDFLTTSGGQVSADSVLYTDLTRDGVEDAVVPVTSGGEGGNIAVFVYGYTAAGLSELLLVTTATSLTVALVEDGIQVTEAAYAPGDPMCCPSDLVTTDYLWDGTAFVSEAA